MQALHVQQTLQTKNFTSCIKDFSYNRSNSYMDMNTIMQALLAKPINILLYNGDGDLEYNFLGQEWVVDRTWPKDPLFKLKVVNDRAAWTYRTQTAGFVKRYASTAQNAATLDELTVKGAGRYVPMDRGGPALQMIYNLIKKQAYSTATPIDVNPKPSGATSFKAIPFTTLWAELSLVFIGYLISRL